MNSGNILYRAACPEDASAIQQLLAIYAAKQQLLPRSENDILEYLANFKVAEDAGRVIGCAALRDFGNNLYELRSLAVLPEYIGKGVGRKLVEKVIADLDEKRPCRLFALTYRTPFFLHIGFHQVNKERFPEKIWADCSKCPKKDHCDEDAVLLEL